MSDLDLATDRSAYTDLIPGVGTPLVRRQFHDQLRDDVTTGLDALAALFFDECTDNNTLPDWLIKAYDEAACMGAWSSRFEGTPTGVAL